MTRETLLVRTMVELADNLVAEFDVIELLTTLSDRCVDVLDVAAAGIMLADGGGTLRPMTSSNEAMRLVELFEGQAQEGPCLDCFHSGQPVVNQDLRGAHAKWPRFAPVAIEAGFLAADALPMRLRGQVIGALNLFRTERGSLSVDDVAVAQALADVATIAILQNRSVVEANQLNEQLSSALSSRVIIEQAKGVIAERQNVPVDEAFQLLRQFSRNHNLRLAETAGRTVRGEIHPGSSDGPTRR